MAEYFGGAAGDATVLELIRMGAGIRDFEDDFSFDQWVLGNGSKWWGEYPYDSMSFAVSSTNTKGGDPLYCNPGTCTAYSSTGYEVAGLLLAAVLRPEGAWYDFDLGSAIFDDRSAYPSMSFPPQGSQTKQNPRKLSQYLTVPGLSVAPHWPKTTIYDQDPSILGCTCGNLVASPRDVAKFFYHLLDADAAHGDAKPLISDASRAEMTNLETLTAGWMAGHDKYGAGLMELTYGRSSHVTLKGHEGQTYGFASSQGYVASLKGAYSIASNVDYYMPMLTMACHLMETAQQVIGGSSETLGCQLAEAEVLI